MSRRATPPRPCCRICGSMWAPPLARMRSMTIDSWADAWGGVHRRLGALERALANLARPGVVTAVRSDPPRVRVAFGAGGLESDWLPWMAARAGDDATWHPPSVDEQVLVLNPGGDPRQGVVLGALYGADSAPAAEPQVAAMRFADGTDLRYDAEAHHLSVSQPGEGARLTVTCAGPVTVAAPAVDLGRDDALEPVVLGERLGRWVVDRLKPWLDGHTHVSAKAGQPTSAARGSFDAGEAAPGGAVYSARNRTQ
ncbi:hypothetical protein CKO24_07850 [Rhodothalassium salexigens DSM 2132]|nr:hypothetical protein [Rhodothalassium salexigens DSM 2132]